MIARIAVLEKTSDPLDEPRLEEFRTWVSAQPGFKGGYHLSDPHTGKTVSISFWETREAMLALKDKTPPGGAMGVNLASVEEFEQVVKF